MAGKALNKKNLLELGPEALADLLLEAVKGDAARQRRVRMALAAEQSPAEAAVDVRKRFAAIRRARSYLTTRTLKTLAKELSDLVTLIDQRIAPDEASLGFDLLWSLLQLSPSIYARTEDNQGRIGEVMTDAMQAIGQLTPRLLMDPEALAETVFEAQMSDEYSAFDHAIPALAEALGAAGLNDLKARAQSRLAEPLQIADLERYAYVTLPARRDELARESRDRMARKILQDVADVQGDVDGWLARYSAEQLTYATIAPEAAQRLLEAGRAQEALQIVQNSLARQAGASAWDDPRDLDDAHFLCLDALGREDDLRAALLARFETRLCAQTLRAYLKRLPDFEDDEALHAARQFVLTTADIHAGLIFCLDWPDARLAAQLVQARADEIDGDHYEVLTPAAELLAPEHPLQATLVWRAMILFALDKGRAGRYRHAARHVMSCAEADAVIADYQTVPDHQSFLDDLRKHHGAKSAFWRRVTQLEA